MFYGLKPTFRRFVPLLILAIISIGDASAQEMPDSGKVELRLRDIVKEYIRDRVWLKLKYSLAARSFREDDLHQFFQLGELYNSLPDYKLVVQAKVNRSKDGSLRIDGLQALEFVKGDNILSDEIEFGNDDKMVFKISAEAVCDFIDNRLDIPEASFSVFLQISTTVKGKFKERAAFSPGANDPKPLFFWFKTYESRRYIRTGGKYMLLPEKLARKYAWGTEIISLVALKDTVAVPL